MMRKQSVRRRTGAAGRASTDHSSAPRTVAVDEPEGPAVVCGDFVFGMKLGPAPSSRSTAAERGTLRFTFNHLMLPRWRGRRSEATIRGILADPLATLERWGYFTPGDVTEDVALRLLDEWLREALSPTLINKRFMYLRTLGVDWVPRVQEPRYRKWWLRPEDYEALRDWLSTWDHPQAGLVADYIEWTVHTGLRVEESLRIRRSDLLDLHTDEPALTVPGTKNDHSGNVTLPIAIPARNVAARRLGAYGKSTDRLFPIPYRTLTHLWQYCRAVIGAEETPTAALRSLRRSAARYLHVECGMPLDVVRQYLRHENVKTTQSYLRLTGGYTTQEMRRWLKPSVGRASHHTVGSNPATDQASTTGGYA